MLRVGAEVLRDVALAARREWVLADGLGGWAAGTVLGLHTRGAHGLLAVASPPARVPMLLLARVEEALSFDGMRHELGANDYGGVLHPRGHEVADSFLLDPLPTLTWEVGGRRLSRTVARLHGEPAVVLAYQLEGAEPATLEVRPLLAYREPEARPERSTHTAGRGVDRSTAERPAQRDAATTARARATERPSSTPAPKQSLLVSSPPPSAKSKKVIQWP